MDNTKKYEILNDDALLAKETEAAYTMIEPMHGMSVVFRDATPSTVANESVAHILARTPEEFEDMKKHSFYAKGNPFPDQPQTWDEVWKEVDNQKEETYLDETESDKALERLWSVLS